MINTHNSAKKILSSITHKPGMLVGYETLDELTYGIRPTELILLAGRPGMGKTASLGDMVLHISKTGVPLVFSMEMGDTEFVERLLVNQAGISYQRTIRDMLQKGERDRLNKAADVLSERNIIIDGTSLHSPQGIERTLQKVLEGGVPVSCVMIDHLQYMRLEPSCNDPYITATEVTKCLKALAREYHLPFVVLSQLSRAVEGRDSHRPRLSDLRDSGSLEQDADQVWFLYRPGYYDSHNVSSEAEIIVAKNRNGPVGIAKVNWNPAVMSFKKPPSLNDIVGNDI